MYWLLLCFTCVMHNNKNSYYYYLFYFFVIVFFITMHFFKLCHSVFSTTNEDFQTINSVARRRKTSQSSVDGSVVSAVLPDWTIEVVIGLSRCCDTECGQFVLDMPWGDHEVSRELRWKGDDLYLEYRTRYRFSVCRSVAMWQILQSCWSPSAAQLFCTGLCVRA